jgi:ribose transport system substrate-binding protein
MSEADAEAIAERRFRVAVVLHTTGSDWARQLLAGISSALGQHQAAIMELVDCGFNAQEQVKAFNRLAESNVDVVISIPIGNQDVSEAHRRIQKAGKKLILLDNAPTGLSPGTDYVSVVSADNFGLGEMAAQLLSPYLPPDQPVGMLAFGVDFFATHEREIAFAKWMAKNRSQLTVVQDKFQSLADVSTVTAGMLSKHPNLSGLFVVWDEPAMIAVDVLSRAGSSIAVTTVDLGNAAATNLATGGNIKGISAQKPYDQGKATATVALLALLGREIPSWVALPGLAVAPENVIQSYQSVWHAPAPIALLKGQRI